MEWQCRLDGPNGLPLLLCPTFMIYVKGSDENANRLVSKFADNAKIDRDSDNDEGCQRIQHNINQLQI